MRKNLYNILSGSCGAVKGVIIPSRRIIMHSGKKRV